MNSEINTEINLIINKLEKTQIKIKISKKLLLKRAKQTLEYKKKKELEINKEISEHEQNIMQLQIKQNKLENEWLKWIINFMKNIKYSGLEIDYIFDTLYDECSLLKPNSDIYKPTFYNILASHLFVYEYITIIKKKLFDYINYFEYKSTHIIYSNFTAPEVKEYIINKLRFLRELHIIIVHEINNRKDINRQLENGYTGYLLFDERKYNIPLSIQNIISQFIIGHKYKIKKK